MGTKTARVLIGIAIAAEAMIIGRVLAATELAPAVAAPDPLAFLTRPVSFADFPVAEPFRGTPAAVDLASHPSARWMRTRLRKGAAQGPNFAGHYAVVTWGNGTNCLSCAIVDVIDGRVFFPGVVSELGLDYRLDSALIVENPPEEFQYADDETPEELVARRKLYGGPNYYVWDGSRLNLLIGDPDAFEN